MLGWMIPTLICIAYFLSEARRAPIIEDDVLGSGDDEAGDRLVSPSAEPKIVEQKLLKHSGTDQ